MPPEDTTPVEMPPSETPVELPPAEPPLSQEPSEAPQVDASAPLPPPGVVKTAFPMDASATTDDDRTMSALAWGSMVLLQIPLVSVVLLLAEGNKDRPFQRYHAITSILFWVLAFIYEILALIAFIILTAVSLGCLAVCLWVIFFLPHLAAVYFAIQAFSGKRTEIPLVSSLARSQGWI